MNYATIKNCDIANGPGVRVSLFVSGCRHRCPDCFNEMAWDFDYGEPFTPEVEERLLAALKPGYIRGLTILGGEPFEPENQPALVEFLKKVRQRLPQKTIWCYTGFTYDMLLHGRAYVPGVTRTMLECLDVLVDGPFIKEQKDLSLSFRGSSNQRIIDVRRTLYTGSVELWHDWQDRK